MKFTKQCKSNTTKDFRYDIRKFKITQTAMAEKLGITPRAVKKTMKELVAKGLVEREGSSRSGYWKIKE